MRSRCSPARRFAGVSLLVVGVLLAAAPGGAGASSLDRRAAADTWFQTIRFSDGSFARVTVTTRPILPSPGEGVDLGTVHAARGPVAAGAQLAPADAEPAPSTRGRPITTLAGSGSETAWGWVNYTNWAGVELWRWIHQVSWTYGSYKVRSVYNHIAASQSSCCLWEYHGTLSKSHSGPGGPNFQAFAQGKYKACITSILCESASPWVWLQGNGNGILTGFSWGIG